MGAPLGLVLPLEVRGAPPLCAPDARQRRRLAVRSRARGGQRGETRAQRPLPGRRGTYVRPTTCRMCTPRPAVRAPHDLPSCAPRPAVRAHTRTCRPAPHDLPSCCVASRDAHDEQDRSPRPRGSPDPDRATGPGGGVALWSLRTTEPLLPGNGVTGLQPQPGPGRTSPSSSERSRTTARETLTHPVAVRNQLTPISGPEPDDADLGAGAAREAGVRRPPRRWRCGFLAARRSRGRGRRVPRRHLRLGLRCVRPCQ